MHWTRSDLLIVDFDIENRPLSYGGQDFTFSDITAIAWSFVGEEEVYCELQTKRPESVRRMLKRFRQAWDKADMGTGHYIRVHDIPIINGALMELGMQPLSQKLTCDTKLDLIKRAGISASQESLADLWDLQEKKLHMAQKDWRAANRLTPEGLEKTRQRVTDDIIQHKELRLQLAAAGYLKAPRVWYP